MKREQLMPIANTLLDFCREWKGVASKEGTHERGDCKGCPFRVSLKTRGKATVNCSAQLVRDAIIFTRYEGDGDGEGR